MSVCLWTPERIRECITYDDDTPMDVFEDAVPLDNPYRDTMIKRLWSMYRYQVIDSMCLDRWVQRLKDCAETIDGRYRLLMEEWEKQQSKLASISAGWTETYDDTKTQTPSGSDTSVHKAEDIPQTAGASASEWLSRRDTDIVTPGTTVTTKAGGTRGHTDDGVLAAERYAQVMDKLDNPYTAYAREFRDLFANYFQLGGCDCGCRRGRSNSSACPAP